VGGPSQELSSSKILHFNASLLASLPCPASSCQTHLPVTVPTACRDRRCCSALALQVLQQAHHCMSTAAAPWWLSVTCWTPHGTSCPPRSWLQQLQSSPHPGPRAWGHPHRCGSASLPLFQGPLACSAAAQQDNHTSTMARAPLCLQPGCGCACDSLPAGSLMRVQKHQRKLGTPTSPPLC
jgi:hypothetical protein